MSEEITYLIHQLEELIHSESIPFAQGVHYAHIFLASIPCPCSAVMCSTGCLLRPSYHCELRSRWTASGVKGRVGLFFQERQKEVVPWLLSFLHVSSVLILNIT